MVKSEQSDEIPETEPMPGRERRQFGSTPPDTGRTKQPVKENFGSTPPDTGRSAAE
ncbi:hypothetical protein WMF01_12085 [Sorangium sp. So ce1667]